MAGNSKHYGDVLKWIEKTIDSCTTRQQLQSCRTLVNNFYILYFDDSMIEPYDEHILRGLIGTKEKTI